MKVFIGGSISIEYLDTKVISQINEYINGNVEVLVGDAYGVDSLVQKYLKDNNYDNVKVYASNGKVRNNLGKWQIEAINVPNSICGRAFYTQKDIAMTTDCDFGFMIWDKKSIGTLTNIQRLIQFGKSCYVYLANEKKLKLITNYSGLENI